MAETKLAFVVQRPPYKSENPKLALTHAIAYQTVEILLEDNELVTPVVYIVGEGVLACIKDQKAMESYGITSTELHLKSCLLVDLKVRVCREDLERFGISEDQLIDAEDMGADEKIEVVPFETINSEMSQADHLLFF